MQCVQKVDLRAAGKLPEFPALGRPGRPETRELSIAALPYLIVYEVSHEAVTIVAVIHTRDYARALHDRIQAS